MHAFEPFLMERWQSTWENRVDYNLSESGVHPLTLAELLEVAGRTVGDVRLGYGYSDGSPALRMNIMRLYPGIEEAGLCVTNGSAEANFLALWTLVEPGTSVTVVTPTYMQTPGLARTMGATVREIRLREELGWQPDPADIENAVTRDTRLLVITNPVNPTGTVLRQETRAALIRAADRAGAWILADEVYAGAELDGAETPTFWGTYPRVIATGSLSKAYGLPGLRLGWVAAPPALTAKIWARKDYTTISTGELTDRLATIALEPTVRPRILARTRTRILAGWQIVRDWLAEQGGFRCLAPEAGAICFARYDWPIGSSELAERLRVEKSVLVVPGDHFEREGFIRIGFGIPPADLRSALGRVAALLAEVSTVRAGPPDSGAG